MFAPAIVDRNRAGEACELVGHHCESGDVPVHGAELATPEIGDLLVMPCTGAYCYSLQTATTAPAGLPWSCAATATHGSPCGERTLQTATAALSQSFS